MTKKSITLYITGKELHGKTGSIHLDERYLFQFLWSARRFTLLKFLHNISFEYLTLNPGLLSLIKVAYSRLSALCKQNGILKTLVHFFPYKITINISGQENFYPHKVAIIGDSREIWTSRIAVNSGSTPYALDHSQEYDFARFQNNFSAFLWECNVTDQLTHRFGTLKNSGARPFLRASEAFLEKDLVEGVLVYHKLENAKIMHARTVISSDEIYPSDLHNYVDGSWPTDLIHQRGEHKYFFNFVTLETKFSGPHMFFGSSTSWFHFLVEVLPRYLLFDRDILKSCVPVMEIKTPPQILEVLSLITSNAPVLLSPGESAEFETLHACTESRFALGLDLLNRKQDILLVQGFFRSHFDLPSESGERLIFIRRSKNLFRYSADAAFLEEFCKGSGFEIVDTGAMSMKEQVDLFASAKLVIGETGSSLTNLLFCNRDTVVIELNLHEFMPGFFADFCNVLDLNHVVVDQIFSNGKKLKVGVGGHCLDIEEFLQAYI